MKRFLTLILGLTIQFQLYATEQEKTWADLDPFCFNTRSRIEQPGVATLKVRTSQEGQLLFVQNQAVLPYKIYQSGQKQFIEYAVVSTAAIAPEKKTDIKHLFDGNFSTSLVFDPYSSQAPEIVIDANRQLKKGQFTLQLHFRSQASVRYFVSKHNKRYIEVDNPEAYHWRYLKVRFVTPESERAKQFALSVSELSLFTRAPTVYLVTSRSNALIDLFSGFECIDEDFAILYGQTRRKAQTTSYSINALTKLFAVSPTLNPEYRADFDSDGILNRNDNCPFHANKEQKDSDRDLVGDACDLDNEAKNFHDRDSDQDGVGDSLDNCVYLFNPGQQDSNADQLGDLCSDDDQDGIIGHLDNCLHISNPDQKDVNVNGIGDACEFDKDKDGVFDSIDNCIAIKNSDQTDQDRDGIGDACDNCSLYNPDQRDNNRNGRGDRCEKEELYLRNNDMDGDGIIDSKDNCQKAANHNQLDQDRDGIGDVCDNCPQLQNSSQVDLDQNGVGDMCEDSDGDGIVGHLDNCPSHFNPDQADAENDGIGDICEDDDRDGIPMANDNCPFQANQDQRDIDRDGKGDVCDNKDDRLLESNRVIVIGIIVLVTALFGFLIYSLVKKLRDTNF